ncbi:MAG: hypothetical protein HQ542_05880 [Bacteroidia bacterium]|nr:hypothetical protein [Bacteroidia bacterium]
MKRVALLNDLKESDIRPEKIYNEYKRLLSKDIQNYFSDPSVLTKIDCPGCSDKNSDFVFSKMGLDYRACNKCGSLFVSPRPSEGALRAFYKNSSSGLFIRKKMLKNTMEARSKKVFSYRIQWIRGLIEEYLPDTKVLLDYATKYPSLLKQLHNTGLFKTIISVLPEFYEQENLLPGNIEIINDNNIEVDSSIDIFSAFEVIERVFDPGKLFSDAYHACKNNGLFIITSATSSGFEYQVLGEYSPNVFPPDRLNLLSLESLTSQIEKAGFEIIEVSTPGRLDVEMVKRTYEKNPDIPIDPFWKYLFRYRDENALHSLQEYLQQFQLSSHVRIACIKR